MVELVNRRERRAARYTKAGRQAAASLRVCEHGNPMKTDGRGEPMCPHGCGFKKPAR